MSGPPASCPPTLGGGSDNDSSIQSLAPDAEPERESGKSSSFCWIRDRRDGGREFKDLQVFLILNTLWPPLGPWLHAPSIPRSGAGQSRVTPSLRRAPSVKRKGEVGARPPGRTGLLQPVLCLRSVAAWPQVPVAPRTTPTTRNQ